LIVSRIVSRKGRDASRRLAQHSSSWLTVGRVFDLGITREPNGGRGTQIAPRGRAGTTSRAIGHQLRAIGYHDIGGVIGLPGLILVFWPGTGEVAISFAALLPGAILILLALRLRRLQQRVGARLAERRG
jgi:hypothetical protein